MKKNIIFLVIGAVLAGGGPANAAYRSFDYAAGLSPAETVDKTKMEGWVTKVDYRLNRFRILDPRGFERAVTVKPGTIGDYRRGDHVRVSLDTVRPWASMVEKI